MGGRGKEVGCLPSKGVRGFFPTEPKCSEAESNGKREVGKEGKLDTLESRQSEASKPETTHPRHTHHERNDDYS